jgi:hypothetical protein
MKLSHPLEAYQPLGANPSLLSHERTVRASFTLERAVAYLVLRSRLTSELARRVAVKREVTRLVSCCPQTKNAPKSASLLAVWRDERDSKTHFGAGLKNCQSFAQVKLQGDLRVPSTEFGWWGPRGRLGRKSLKGMGDTIALLLRVDQRCRTACAHYPDVQR